MDQGNQLPYRDHNSLPWRTSTDPHCRIEPRRATLTLQTSVPAGNVGLLNGALSSFEDLIAMNTTQIRSSHQVGCLLFATIVLGLVTELFMNSKKFKFETSGGNFHLFLLGWLALEIAAF